MQIHLSAYKNIALACVLLECGQYKSGCQTPARKASLRSAGVNRCWLSLQMAMITP